MAAAGKINMYSRKVFLLLSSLVLIIFLLLASNRYIAMNRAPEANSAEIVKVWVEGAPYSSDPLEYDAFAHHVIFRSVYASLVTQYKQGEFTPILAESWSASDDFRTWSFKIRKGVYFSNGDEITPAITLKSLKRIAYLLKARKSQSGLFENLEGFELFEGMDSVFSGMRLSDSNQLIFQFKRPFKKALETVGFGLYSIVHPSQFDSRTGQWLDPRHSVSSGPYQIETWTSELIKLKTRPFIKEFAAKDSISNIEIRWSDSSRSENDLIMGTSDETAFSDTHEFFGGAASEIGYLQCMSWSDSSSPCRDLNLRRQLRDSFYDDLRSRGFGVSGSFFPLVMKGIQEPKKSNASNPVLPSNELLRVRPTAFGNPVFSQGYNHAMSAAAKASGLRLSFRELSRENLLKESAPNLAHYSVDVAARGTGILVDDPTDDIRFMFLSKEGIRLPDTDGKILAALSKLELDPQEINQLIWNQAVVWPVVHYASGFWSRKGRFDFSSVNLVLPPTEFQWIKRR